MAAVGFWGLSSAARDSGGAGKIAPEKVAEYVHAVIEADRTIYTTHVVDRMQEKGVTPAECTATSGSVSAVLGARGGREGQRPSLPAYQSVAHLSTERAGH